MRDLSKCGFWDLRKAPWMWRDAKASCLGVSFRRNHVRQPLQSEDKFELSVKPTFISKGAPNDAVLVLTELFL